MGSGSYKDSYRKLRAYTLSSNILVNMCWPFGQHIHTLYDVHVRKWALWISGKRDFPVYKRGTPWNMIRDHHIVGMRSNNIGLDFPKRSESNIDSRANIFSFDCFLYKKQPFSHNFWTKNSQNYKFLRKSQNLTLNV